MCEYCLEAIVGWLPEKVTPTHHIQKSKCDGHYEVKKIEQVGV